MVILYRSIVVKDELADSIVISSNLKVIFSFMSTKSDCDIRQ